MTEWKIKRPHFVAVPVALLRLRSPTHRRRGQTRLKVRLHLRFDQQVFSSPHRVQIAYFRSGQCFGESRVTMVPLHRAPVMARTVTKKNETNKRINYKKNEESSRSIRSGASRLPCYCAPLVCVSGVIDSLAMWRHYKPKTKKTISKKERKSQPTYTINELQKRKRKRTKQN